jgi:hypothetical protein
MHYGRFLTPIEFFISRHAFNNSRGSLIKLIRREKMSFLDVEHYTNFITLIHIACQKHKISLSMRTCTILWREYEKWKNKYESCNNIVMDSCEAPFFEEEDWV